MLQDVAENPIKYAIYGLIYLIFALWIASYALFSWYDFQGIIWPHHIIQYAIRYYSKYPHTHLVFWISIGLSFVPLLGLALRVRDTKALHGDARWANLKEIKKMGLINEKEQRGIIFSKYPTGWIKSHFIRDDEVEHVLVVAPTRAGKGVGIVVPNLLEWHGSAIVLDIKYENFNITAHRRKHDLKNEVYFFAPGNKNSHCWNPFDLIDLDDPFGMATVDMIAMTLCPTNRGTTDPMWTSEGRNIFKGALLYLMTLAKIHNEKNPSMGELNSWIRLHTEDEAMDEILAYIESDNQLKEKLPKISYTLLKNFRIMPEKQRGSVQTTITSQLSTYDDPAVDAAVAHSDFDIRDLRKRKITIYLGANPKTTKVLAPLFGMFFQLTTNELISYLPSDAATPEPYKVLLIMDEFTSMGELDVIKSGIAFYAGYHVRLIVIIQGKAQLESLYQASGLSEFLANFKFQIVYAPNDPREAKDLSDSLGTDTVLSYSRSLPGLLSKGDKSLSESKQGRALITTDEIMRLDRAKSIIRVEAQRPILGRKVIYWKDPFFKGKFWNILNPATKKATAKRRPPLPPLLKTDHPYLEERIAAKLAMGGEKEKLGEISNKVMGAQEIINRKKKAKKRKNQEKRDKEMTGLDLRELMNDPAVKKQTEAAMSGVEHRNKQSMEERRQLAAQRAADREQALKEDQDHIESIMHNKNVHHDDDDDLFDAPVTNEGQTPGTNTGKEKTDNTAQEHSPQTPSIEPKIPQDSQQTPLPAKPQTDPRLALIRSGTHTSR